MEAVTIPLSLIILEVHEAAPCRYHVISWVSSLRPRSSFILAAVIARSKSHIIITIGRSSNGMVSEVPNGRTPREVDAYLQIDP